MEFVKTENINIQKAVSRQLYFELKMPELGKLPIQAQVFKYSKIHSSVQMITNIQSDIIYTIGYTRLI